MRYLFWDTVGIIIAGFLVLFFHSMVYAQTTIIYDKNGNRVGTIEQPYSWEPKYSIYDKDHNKVGEFNAPVTSKPNGFSVQIVPLPIEPITPAPTEPDPFSSQADPFQEPWDE